MPVSVTLSPLTTGADTCGAALPATDELLAVVADPVTGAVVVTAVLAAVPGDVL